MSDRRRKRLADILVNYSLELQPGEWVLIRGNIAAEPLIHDIVEKITEAGAHSDIFFESEAISETKLRLSNEEQAKWVSPLMFARHLREHATVIQKPHF